MKGYFISFEGGDGCGKSTQISLFEDYCRSRGYDVVSTREPGGTPISEKIRSILLDADNSEMSPVTEALLYAASRAQHVEEKIRPAVESGKIVVCDRFLDSSIAYQGYARGLGDGVRVINEFAVEGTLPDLTFFLKLDPETGMKRVENGRGEKDRLELEAMDFHKKVYDGYIALCKLYKGRIIPIDAGRTIEEVAEDIRKAFDEYIAERTQ